MTKRVEGRISLRFKDDSADALSAVMTLGAALGASNVEVVAIDLTQVEVAASDQQP